ncbi:hypothetical protein LNKW23_18030 [Paralimibaculum aggregatum]|uniref:Uncharacterized protein n=1 Tax=Paralimibaculum aggregatum TaxID=3036245 RepID=A0ABQ6LH16_9RHOB|nr:hypothetical protein [Limibaculum sp. NKW23]GMG82590.1 hypothetical protein LNKW23_18030 [Limibaculum sp. NKW23]
MSYNAKVHNEQGGDALAVADGGSLKLGTSVTLSVSGTSVVLTGLPTSDPSEAGALWVNSGVLSVSSG